MSFPRYKIYRVSGSKWLGEVPSHWQVAPVKRSITVKSGEMISASEETETGHPIIGGNGLRGYTDKTNTTADTLVIGRVGALCGCVHHVKDDFWASEHAYRVIEKQPLSRRFFFHLLSALDLNRFAIKTAQPLLNTEIVESQWLAIPPLAEQAVIAAFLDREIAKIDALVAEQQRLIELLKEKRQAVISHAVTKGLDPNAPMKESGVEWLGDVPAHWDVTSIKRLCSTITDGAHISPETEGGVYCFVSTKDVTERGIDLDGCLRTSQTSYEYLVHTGCRPLVGDVLFSKDGTIGRTVVVADEREFVVASSLIIIRPDKKQLDSAFLHFLCQSVFIRSQVDSYVKGAGLPRLSIQNLLRVVGVFPPLDDQKTIAAYLELWAGRYDTLMAESEVAINLLKERRSTLISAAVTGKIDVRALVSTEAKAA